MSAPTAQYDVFLSYAREDTEVVAGLRAALDAIGLVVFQDITDIQATDPITPTIVAGLRASKIVVAYYSETYPTKRYCQWELTQAVVAGERAEDARVWVVNPEADHGHIRPTSLANASLPPVLDGAWEETAAAIQNRAGKIETPLESLLVSTAFIPTVGINLNAGPNRFVGRQQELWDIHGLLKQDPLLVSAARYADAAAHSAAGPTQVHGLAGIGKSLLAQEYAQRYKAAYPGGIFWVTAGEGGQGLENQDSRRGDFIRRVVEQLMPDTVLPQELKPDQILGLAKRELAQLGAYLWVVDDLPLGARHADVREWVAPTDNGQTLITTRDASDKGVGQRLALDCLADPAAFALLTVTQKPTSDAEADAARQICVVLGNHALAVALAGHLVPRRCKTFAGLLERLQDPDQEALDLAATLMVDLPTPQSKSISEVLKASLQPIEDQPLALDILRIAAVLAPQQWIPDDFVKKVLAAADDRPIDEDDFALSEALELLAAQSLCQWDGDGFSSHAVTGRAVGQLCAGDRMDALLDAALKAATELFEALAQDNRKHGPLIPLIPHSEHLVQTLAAVGQAELAVELCIFNRAIGKYNDSLNFARRSVSFCETHLDSDHLLTLKAKHEIAFTLNSLGDYASALKLREEILQIHERIHEPDHPDTLTCKNNLANTLSALGDHEAARKMHEELVRDRERVNGPDRLGTLISKGNLADTLRSLGDYEAARKMEQEVLEVLGRVFGSDNPHTLTCKNNLAATLSALGDHEAARKMEQEVLEVQGRVLGPDHPNTLLTKNNLAFTFLKLRELDQAEDLMRETLDGLTRVLGPEHPRTKVSRESLEIIRVFSANATKD